MKESRFSEEQIVGILKEQQAGLLVAEVCRRHGISDATFYTWRSRFGGMEVSDGRRLKALDEENRKLKKLLAEAMLDVATLREALDKTSGARPTQNSRELGRRGERHFATSRLRADRPCRLNSESSRCRGIIDLMAVLLHACKEFLMWCAEKYFSFPN